MFRWLRRFLGFEVFDPLTVDDWSERMHSGQTWLKESCINMALELGEDELARRMGEETIDAFPGAEYLIELEALRKGAGMKAFRRAQRKRPHR
jgi:hypothetical protein